MSLYRCKSCDGPLDRAELGMGLHSTPDQCIRHLKAEVAMVDADRKEAWGHHTDEECRAEHDGVAVVVVDHGVAEVFPV